MMILLMSVGTILDNKTLLTYPMMNVGGIDFSDEIHLLDCCDDWYNSLSKEDREVVHECLVNNKEKGVRQYDRLIEKTK